MGCTMSKSDDEVATISAAVVEVVAATSSNNSNNNRNGRLNRVSSVISSHRSISPVAAGASGSSAGCSFTPVLLSSPGGGDGGFGGADHELLLSGSILTGNPLAPLTTISAVSPQCTGQNRSPNAVGSGGGGGLGGRQSFSSQSPTILHPRKRSSSAGCLWSPTAAGGKSDVKQSNHDYQQSPPLVLTAAILKRNSRSTTLGDSVVSGNAPLRRSLTTSQLQQRQHLSMRSSSGQSSAAAAVNFGIVCDYLTQSDCGNEDGGGDESEDDEFAPSLARSDSVQVVSCGEAASIGDVSSAQGGLESGSSGAAPAAAAGFLTSTDRVAALSPDPYDATSSNFGFHVWDAREGYLREEPDQPCWWLDYAAQDLEFEYDGDELRAYFAPAGKNLVKRVVKWDTSCVVPTTPTANSSS